MISHDSDLGKYFGKGPPSFSLSTSQWLLVAEISAHAWCLIHIYIYINMFKIVKVHFWFFDRTRPPKNSINLTSPAGWCPHSIKSRAHDMRHNLCVAQGHDGQMLQLRPAREWSHPPTMLDRINWTRLQELWCFLYILCFGNFLIWNCTYIYIYVYGTWCNHKI